MLSIFLEKVSWSQNSNYILLRVLVLNINSDTNITLSLFFVQLVITKVDKSLNKSDSFMFISTLSLPCSTVRFPICNFKMKSYFKLFKLRHNSEQYTYSKVWKRKHSLWMILSWIYEGIIISSHVQIKFFQWKLTGKNSIGNKDEESIWYDRQ